MSEDKEGLLHPPDPCCAKEGIWAVIRQGPCGPCPCAPPVRSQELVWGLPRRDRGLQVSLSGAEGENSEGSRCLKGIALLPVWP